MGSEPLASAAVNESLRLGSKIAVVLKEPNPDLQGWLASDLGGQRVLSKEMVAFATSHVEDVRSASVANKLAFLILSAQPDTSVARLISTIASKTFARSSAALLPLIELGDLVSLLRWKLWNLSSEQFTSQQILKHPGLAAYISVIARRVVIDECRALTSRVRASGKQWNIEASLDPRTMIDAVLDDLDVLQRVTQELPPWQRPLLSVMTDQIERAAALDSINRARQAAELPPWTMDSLRTALHRLRARIREAVAEVSPSPRSTTSGMPMTSTPRDTRRDSAARGLPDRRRHHAWKRFWRRRDKSYSLGDGGFLFDPESQYGRQIQPDAVALEQLDATGCLVLLGEPGIGKSTTLADEHDRLTATGAIVYAVDLLRAANREELHRISEVAACSTTGPCFLFLDGLDEGIARNASLSEQLAEVLGQCDRTKLRLRISCRALEWPSRFEDKLKELWPGSDAVQVYELLPLRRVDVRAAAEDYQVAPEQFIEAVRDRDSTSLAIRPISLRFLIEMYAREGTLPHSKLRLFNEGTLLLCLEESTWHHGSGRPHADAFRRRAIAARIAAISTFTNRHVVTRDGKTEDSIQLPDMVGGTEGTDGASYEVTAQALNDTLVGTALFFARSSDSFVWTHQSYREFLAAWYLGHRDLDLNTVASLYFPGGENTRVPGPLREVAAWHATLVPALFDLLVGRDPDVLMHSDSAAISPASRKQLVDALLRRMDNFEAVDSSYWEDDYRKLAHDELALQLRPYIRATSRNIIVRRAAMNIAWSCAVTELVSDLSAVLENPSEDVHARECAARALARLGGRDSRAALSRVLAGGLAFDLSDDIRGAALDALWPDYMDPENLLNAITSEKRPNYAGGYASFLDEFPCRLPLVALPAALEWVERMGDPDFDSIGRAQARILSRAIDHLEDEQILAQVARLIKKSLKLHQRLFGADRPDRALSVKALTGDHRRAILDAVIRLDPDDEQLGKDAVFSEPPLLRVEDMTWLASAALRETDTKVQAALGRLTEVLDACFSYPADPVVADAVARTVEECDAFRGAIADLFAPIGLESATADRLREQWNTTRESFERREARNGAVQATDEESMRERLRLAREALTQIEAGDVDRWVALCRVLTHPGYKAIQSTQSWRDLAGAQERIVLAAATFLNTATPPTPEWMNDNSIPWEVAAARAAFVLIGSERSDALAGLSDDAWRHWGCVMVAVHVPTCPDALRVELTKRAYRYGLESVIGAVRRIARREDRQQQGIVTVFGKLPLPLPGQLQVEILDFVDELGDQGYEAALAALVASGSEEACARALSTLAAAPASRAAHAARVVLPLAPVHWDVVLRRMEAERDFTGTMAELLAEPFEASGVFATLDGHLTARLFLVVLRSFPPASDPRREGVGVLTARDSIVRLRERLIGMLVKQGAVTEIEWLVTQEPSSDVLRWQLVDARELLADTSWKPIGVAEFLRTARVLGVAVVLRDTGPHYSLVFDAEKQDAARIAKFLSGNIAGIEVHADSKAVTVDGPPEAMGRLLELAESGAVSHAAVGARLLGIRFGDEWVFEEAPLVRPIVHGLRDVSAGQIKELLGRTEVVLATATDVETDAVLSAMEPLPGEDRLLEGSLDIATYRVGLFGRYLAAHLQSDMGSTGARASQLTISDAIREVDPKVVFMIGIAFGLKRARQRLGDVLVAEHITGYEMVKLRPDTLDERGPTIPGSILLGERIKSRRRDWTYARADGTQVDVVSGQVVSGEKLVNNKEFRDALVARFPTAVGGEMEGVGAYAAAQRQRREILLVKSICDWADGLKNDRAQAFAAATATSIVRHVLGKRDALGSLGVSEYGDSSPSNGGRGASK